MVVATSSLMNENLQSSDVEMSDANLEIGKEKTKEKKRRKIERKWRNEKNNDFLITKTSFLFNSMQK